MTATSPEWTVEQWAGGCTKCGSPTQCPQWTVASASAGRPVLTCQPYPCFCLATRANAPDYIEDPQCWWRDKKRGGRLTSRCPCWGRERDDRLPQDCCSRHEANPAYIVEHLEAGIRGPVVEAATGSTGTSEAPARTASARTAAGSTTGQAPSYTRRWTHQELHCDCKTPWDGQKTAGGFHCSECHTNWVNVATAMVHQKYVTDPCRDPVSIVDCENGRPLLYARDVRGVIVWAFAW